MSEVVWGLKNKWLANFVTVGEVLKGLNEFGTSLVSLHSVLCIKY